MKISRYTAIAVLLVAIMGVSGCTDTDIPREENDLETSLPWQSAKADTQKTALEIAGLIPKDKVTSVLQKETGVLLSCNRTDHNWNGWTDITLTSGANVEEVIKGLELHYRESRFEVTTRTGIDGDYQVHLLGPAPSEGYLIGRGLTPNVIRIDSGSPCFTLPEGTYPGGDF
ncbi:MULTISPECIES: hypothetical protein [Paenarthrobacter]|jgi:hypothetical protein|uniref:hypothetical protein n=1 Tax=Paenarthrobacter TaxID=1742992 RepID=UPI0028593B04|nr:hypothetical protein [Paenarthrobacter nitroguajacolicus]MDR6987892.1 hypothetical protein [Paenarthrobacter nitroguajacolicus]